MSANINAIGNQFTGLLDVFIDPESAVKRLHRRSAWLAPWLIVGIGSVIVGLACLPIIMQVVEQTMPASLSEDQLHQTLGRIQAFQQVGIYLGALALPLRWLLIAGIVYLSCLLFKVRVTYRSLFALAAQLSLLNLLESIATYVILNFKRGEIQSIADLSPGLGLNLFISSSSKPLMVIINFVSLFNIWYIIILCLGLSYLSGCSKRRAFAATTFAWLIPLSIAVGITILS